MIHPRIADADARRQALLPERSFIVQAPAGSGKTELLIQRYLMLLARVEAPEEIVAITFTRKGAAEMRDRITTALASAREHQPAVDSPAYVTWKLARAVRQQDAKRGWGLEYHPARLRIQTIDSLCASLTRQMPLLSRFGAQPGITETAEALYRQAARATLAEVESGAEWSASVEALLRYLDNDWSKIEALLAAMLARRDQWLRHNYRQLQREALEKSLQATIRAGLQRVSVCCPSALMVPWLAFARFAAANIICLDSTSPIGACLHLQACPEAELEALPQWLGLAHLVLTTGGEWRKQITQAIGFPPPGVARTAEEKQNLKTTKEAFKDFLNRLRGEERLRCALQALRSLPPPHYTESQWAIMEALFQLLPLTVAQLRLVFQERGEVDFTEVAQQAVVALGSPEVPTDLALALDYQIQHLLMDEFQDTSLSQYILLERLTAGWEPGDGRSLFLVGDPMQSIYRFREAEVGLYLRTWRQGIGALQLTPLTLLVNFRSQQELVEWANQAFSQILPDIEDPVTGAVPYCRAHSFHPPLAAKAVQVYPFFEGGALEEARTVVRLVQETKRAAPETTIAILVRTRTHLSEIIPLFREAKLPFRAIDIEPLGSRPVVQDLVALTKALFHPADRLSWLTVLRAPWCGLTLHDLHTLVGEDLQAVIWEQLNNESSIRRLSGEGRQRLSRVRPIFAKALAERRRIPPRRLVEGVWLALGGPACLAEVAALEEAYIYLDLLEREAIANEIVDFRALDEAVARLFAPPDKAADDSLQVMTIHRAKGLEFDTVIVPGLGRFPRHESSQLLLWAEQPAFNVQRSPENQLLLAPIPESGGKAESIYQYIKELHEEKDLLEIGRLLYVVVTRARQRLHLLGQVRRDANGQPRSPPKRSLLASLWPAVKAEFEAAAVSSGGSTLSGEVPQDLPGSAAAGLFFRLVADWQCPEPVSGVKVSLPNSSEAASAQGVLEFAWVGETARYIGVVAHHYLQVIAREGLHCWNEARIAALGPAFARALRAQGVAVQELEKAVKRTQDILSQMLSDERGRWILAPHHQRVRNEYPLSGLLNGRVVRAVIDRTFVDEKGIRWIIDYKTGAHEGGDREGFLDREQERYRTQLENYAALMAAKEATVAKIRLGLYYLQFCGWREWCWPTYE